MLPAKFKQAKWVTYSGHLAYGIPNEIMFGWIYPGNTPYVGIKTTTDVFTLKVRTDLVDRSSFERDQGHVGLVQSIEYLIHRFRALLPKDAPVQPLDVDVLREWLRFHSAEKFYDEIVVTLQNYIKSPFKNPATKKEEPTMSTDESEVYETGDSCSVGDAPVGSILIAPHCEPWIYIKATQKSVISYDTHDNVDTFVANLASAALRKPLSCTLDSVDGEDYIIYKGGTGTANWPDIAKSILELVNTPVTVGSTVPLVRLLNENCHALVQFEGEDHISFASSTDDPVIGEPTNLNDLAEMMYDSGDCSYEPESDAYVKKVKILAIGQYGDTHDIFAVAAKWFEDPARANDTPTPSVSTATSAAVAYTTDDVASDGVQSVSNGPALREEDNDSVQETALQGLVGAVKLGSAMAVAKTANDSIHKLTVLAVGHRATIPLVRFMTPIGLRLLIERMPEAVLPSGKKVLARGAELAVAAETYEAGKMLIQQLLPTFARLASIGHQAAKEPASSTEIPELPEYAIEPLDVEVVAPATIKEQGA